MSCELRQLAGKKKITLEVTVFKVPVPNVASQVHSANLRRSKGILTTFIVENIAHVSA